MKERDRITNEGFTPLECNQGQLGQCPEAGCISKYRGVMCRKFNGNIILTSPGIITAQAELTGEQQTSDQSFI